MVTSNAGTQFRVSRMNPLSDLPFPLMLKHRVVRKNVRTCLFPASTSTLWAAELMGDKKVC